MSDQPPRTSDATEVFVASLRQRSVPVNTIKSYANANLIFRGTLSDKQKAT